MGHHQVTATESANCANNGVSYLTVLNSSSRKETNMKMKQIQNGTENEKHNGIEIEIDEGEIAYLRSLVVDPTCTDVFKKQMVS